MTPPPQSPVRVAIACGGTGGHLFPGLAVAEQLQQRGAAVTLLVSPKDVDQEAVRRVSGMQIVTLPAVGLTRGQRLAFVRGCWQSYRAARKHFREHPPRVVLAMGGFTSAAPVLAAKRLGAPAFLHESNSIPGRANRWLSWLVDGAFVGFPSGATGLHTRKATVTGTPVRSGFAPRDAAVCRVALGLDPARPLILVTGGSQGASALNDLVTEALPRVAQQAPECQWLHLTGPSDVEKVQRAYSAARVSAVVRPFMADMETALGAATVALSRAGASSLAELAAMRLPAVLVPYPFATDNHQYHNALALAKTGAARLLGQTIATPEAVSGLLVELVHSATARKEMQKALAQWHAPRAAEQIANIVLQAAAQAFPGPVNDGLRPRSAKGSAGDGGLRVRKAPSDLSDASDRSEFSSRTAELASPVRTRA